MRWNLCLSFRGIIAVEKELDLKESVWLRSCINFFGLCDEVIEDKNYVAVYQDNRWSKWNSNWTEEIEGKILVVLLISAHSAL